MPIDKETIKAIERDVDKILTEKISGVVELIHGEPRQWNDTDHFENDLLFDSLDYAGLIIDVEDSFNLNLENETDDFPMNKKACQSYILKKIIERENARESINYSSNSYNLE